jgi:CRP/FNR family cyclic AMP-dependent transcriptional regulator
MDTSAFFQYPTLPAQPPAAAPAHPGLLPHASMRDWDALLAATETLRFRAGEIVLAAGARDRALYLLLDGRLAVEDASAVTAPDALGVAAFLDGLPGAVTVRAISDAELARLSWDAYEALAARDPMLGRTLLLDLAAGLAARLRAAGATLPGWNG